MIELTANKTTQQTVEVTIEYHQPPGVVDVELVSGDVTAHPITQDHQVQVQISGGTPGTHVLHVNNSDTYPYQHVITVTVGDEQ